MAKLRLTKQQAAKLTHIALNGGLVIANGSDYIGLTCLRIDTVAGLEHMYQYADLFGFGTAGDNDSELWNTEKYEKNRLRSLLLLTYVELFGPK